LLSRKPSLRAQISTSNLNKTSSYKESQRELSDNGKLLSRNDFGKNSINGGSRDILMKSQDRFTNTS
jgi:hypothetical protein